MAHSLSAKKRIRQNEKRRLQNHATKARARTAIRRFEELLETNDIGQAETLLSLAYKHTDKAVKQHIFHKNAGARMKSRLSKALNETKQKQTAATETE